MHSSTFPWINPRRTKKQTIQQFCCSFAGVHASESTAESDQDAGRPLAADTAGATGGHSSPVSPPRKRSRGDYLLQFEDAADTTPQFTDEVSRYLEATVQTSEDILHWWRDRSSSFPRLASVAKGILAIPASSAASERSFSVAGATVSDRRSALDSDTVEQILFVHSNS